jgi:transglutaminase-like putative cysteine protease
MSRASALCLTVLVPIGLGVWGACGPVSGDSPLAKEIPSRFQKLPKGWALKGGVVYPDRKLGAVTVRLSNTVLAFEGQELKVNIVECQTDEDAAKVHDLLLRAHRNAHAQCPREGKSVAEFVCNDLRLIERAYQELDFKPPKVAYEVSFRAAPVESCDYMQWNKMYNAFLAPNPNEVQIRELARSFTFGDQIRVRTCGLGGEPISFTFNPRPRERMAEADGDVAAYSFADLPRKHGLPELGVALTITAEAFALTPTKRKAGTELLQPTEFWPSDDPDVVALAKDITAGKATARDKIAAILDWLMPGRNLKYSGQEMGSRYGVKKVLQQGFGHCWDFSDCFVTLCRAASVPSRQVLGWLHGQSGHVWAEVLLDGEGWRQVDPTAGMGCDCRYIPYIASEAGKMPIVYTSAVDIRLKR